MAADTFYFDMQWAEPGLGQAGDFPSGSALPIGSCGEIPIETGASGETNTLAAPLKAGLELTLTMITDGGGDRVVTVAHAINAAGNTIMTFGDVGDSITLKSVEGPLTAGVKTFKWKVLCNDGVALS